MSQQRRPMGLYKRTLEKVARTPVGYWYLKKLAPRLDPPLLRLTGGRVSSLYPAPVMMLTTTGAMVFRTVRSAQPRNDLLGPGGVVAILGFVAVTIGVSLPVAFTLKASGVSYAATIGVSVTAVMLVVGGPMLMRYLQGRMLANRSGSRR